MKMQCNSTNSVVENRKYLIELFKSTPLPVEQLMTNLHMYMRSTILAKVLYLNELYELIKKTTGSIFEFGCWYGANMVTFENLRAVYEPYNYTRKVVGFDTFSGYCSISPDKDKGELIIDNNYSTGGEKIMRFISKGFFSIISMKIPCRIRKNMRLSKEMLRKP